MSEREAHLTRQLEIARNALEIARNRMSLLSVDVIATGDERLRVQYANWKDEITQALAQIDAKS